MQQILRLSDDPGALSKARRFVREAMLDATVGRRSDAELITTELVTNALIHGEAPVTVRISTTGPLTRIEVQDGSRIAPLRGVAGNGSMTGRGLALVEALSDRWGVSALDGGKVVWVEVGAAADAAHAPGPPDLDSWPDLEPVSAEERYELELGDVPTDLLISAKAHVDNLVREFTLAAMGAASGATAEVPAPLARLMRTVTTRFAEARQEIKRQALTAAAHGESRTRLTLRLPISAARAGEDYLAAMDEADSYARAARLLTLETPPAHRAFRRWYVTALVGQLDQISAGLPPDPPPSFEQHLLGELASVTAAQRAAERAARLQQVTAALAAARSIGELASAVVGHGVAALEASGGGLLVPQDDHLAVPGTVGYDDALIAQLQAERADAPLPAATALRTGQPVWLESREERDREFPTLTGLEPGVVSMCAVPLVARGEALGALRFSFDATRLFDEDERRFVLALAAQAAQALDRVRLDAAQREARHDAETAAARLGRLQQITSALAGARSRDEAAAVVAGATQAALGADFAALCVLDPDGQTVRVVAVHGARPGSMERWSTFPLAAPVPASEAIRTQQPLVVRGRQEIERRYPKLTGEVREGTLACAPFTSAAGSGTLALIFDRDRVIDPEDTALMVTIASQCAQALERAELFEAEHAARMRSAFLADASGLLTSSLEPAQTVVNLTRLLVPTLAEWAVIYLLDGDRIVPTVAHRDPAAGALLERMLAERPLDIDAAGGAGEVLRTGRSIRHQSVPREVLRWPSAPDVDPAVAGLVPRTALIVPLVHGSGVLGVIVLGRADGPAFSDVDQLLLEDVAARAASAIANAALYDRERATALMLQRSLLPQEVPTVPGLDLAWRYLPGAAGTNVGGDWYDVIPTSHGKVALVIGDVMGRGLRAAAVMGQLRAIARAHVDDDVDPASVVTGLDTALERLAPDQITTVLVALLDPVTRRLTVASAGHLPPLLVGRDGTTSLLDLRQAPPLGAGARRFDQSTCTLPEGGLLLLYTDGLVESRTVPVDVGLEVLRSAAAGSTGADDLCERVLRGLGRDRAHEDDTALLAVALSGPTAG